MIYQALQFTHDALNQFLRTRFGLDETKVELNNLIEASGNVPQINQNKLVLSLINIEKETARPFYTRQRQQGNGNFADMQPSERYNLDVLVSANFDDYGETLKFLNAAILFFQAHAALDMASFPTMPDGLFRLEFEIEKIGYQDMQGLWTAMGAKYQPSVVYKMRLITMQADEATGFTPAITQTAGAAHP